MSDAMRHGIENPEPRQDIIREMREMAARGTSVRELSNLVRSRLDLGERAVIDQLFYFTKAFRVASFGGLTAARVARHRQ